MVKIINITPSKNVLNKVGKVLILEKNLLKAKQKLLELLKQVKKHRELTFQEQEIALFLIAEEVSNVRLGIPPKRIKIGEKRWQTE